MALQPSDLARVTLARAWGMLGLPSIVQHWVIDWFMCAA
jgi:hypothetical protein